MKLPAIGPKVKRVWRATRPLRWWIVAFSLLELIQTAFSLHPHFWLDLPRSLALWAVGLVFGAQANALGARTDFSVTRVAGTEIRVKYRDEAPSVEDFTHGGDRDKALWALSSWICVMIVTALIATNGTDRLGGEVVDYAVTYACTALNVFFATQALLRAGASPERSDSPVPGSASERLQFPASTTVVSPSDFETK
jgi:hypothetical protein